MTQGIYALKNSVTGDCYVGSSQNIEERCQHHLAELQRGAHINSRLQRAWDKYGTVLEPIFLEVVSEKRDLILREQFHIEHRGVYNLIPAGESPSFKGGIQTEEAKERISLANKGRKRSPETRAKIAAARRGTKSSPKAIAKMRAGLIGLRRSEKALTNYRASWTPERRAKQAAAITKIPFEKRGLSRATSS